MPFEVRIEKIVAGGDGLARHDGRVVFVPGTVPGERHLVEAQQEKKDYIKAQSVSRVESAKERREPPCPYYESCGGCSLMHLSPDTELEVKSGILAECLERSGARFVSPESVACPDSGYRTRLRFHVSRDGDRLSMGFRHRGSHRVEDIENCLLASTRLNEVWRRIRVWARERPPWTRTLTSIEIQESSHEPGRVFARFFVRSFRGIRGFDRRQKSELLHETSLDGVVVTTGEGGREVRAGRPIVHHQVGALRLRQSPGSFFQANRFLLGELVSAVVPETLVSRGVDLYCGVGLFALPIAAAGVDVIGVESSAAAVRDAKANALAAGLGEVRFVRGDATRFAQDFDFTKDDYVVLDPPRGGVPRQLRDALGLGALREFCYVSCDAPALGRDAAHFQSMGFRLERLVLLDLFPNTHHFETVARFSRRGPLDLPPGGG